MNDIVVGALRWALRLAVLAVGVLFFLGLLTVATVLALLWGACALCARITGRPVVSWAMRMNPREGWSTVYRSTARWTAPRSSRACTTTTAHITDVVAREIR